MFLPIYLALTAQEFAYSTAIPSTLCYLSCHFSPRGNGLSNIPTVFPEGSILCIDDSTPIANHSTNVVTEQINTLIQRLRPCGILLDFQRPDNPYAPDMIGCILEGVSCPVAVSHIYAKEFMCPVFLPPLPFRTALSDYLKTWSDREIWLELGNDKEMAIVTENGFGVERVYSIPEGGNQFRDIPLLFHYCTHLKQDHIVFYFHRTEEDLRELQVQAQKLGVSKFLGLWQQLQQFYS